MERWNKPKNNYSKAADHYDKAYFLDQTRDGDLRGEINSWKFEQFAKNKKRILDFGCGDGALLNALGGSYGVEINSHSAEVARNRGMTVASNLAEFDDSMFDLIISNHCLEHVENPLEIIREMRRVISDDGLLAIVVASHRPGFPYCEKDRDYHLFSWSSANLGNMVKLAGFEIIEARELLHRWPPKWRMILNYAGYKAFHCVSRVWALLDRRASQVMCVAKPSKKSRHV